MDNRKYNLRILSRSDNSARQKYSYSNGYKCVTRRGWKYFANVKVNGINIPSFARKTKFQAAVDMQNSLEIFRPSIQEDIIFSGKVWVGI